MTEYAESTGDLYSGLAAGVAVGCSMISQIASFPCG